MPDSHLTTEFRPRARLLQLLGDQLIANPRLAVFELVKNAYDADATHVSIVFEKINTRDARIVIEDNGTGMSETTIKNIWLVPGHDHREQQRLQNKRTEKGRLPLGEKGVGRFAVHKLGDKIKLITREEGHDECTVEIDWAKLTNVPMLHDAKVEIFTHATPNIFKNSSGTRIELSKLRESRWGRREIRNLYRQIVSISSPFGKDRDDFIVEFSVPDQPSWIVDLPDVEHILSQAPWRYSFALENGTFSFEYSFRGVPGVRVEPRTLTGTGERLKLPLRSDWDANLDSTSTQSKVVADQKTTAGIGTVKGHFYAFDRDRSVMSQFANASGIKMLLDEGGGVRVYRDGIRVYNYGESEDDWLGLDLRRVQNPTMKLSRNIMFGAIELELADSAGLREKTNREGFVENQAYARLRAIVLGALADFETHRFRDKEAIRKSTLSLTERRAERLTQPLENLRSALANKGLEREFAPILARIQADYQELQESSLRVGVSGLGLAVVFHEVEHGVRTLYGALEAGASPDSVLLQAKELMRVLDGFSELLRKGERKRNSLKKLIQRSREVSSVRFRNHDVKLVCPILEDENDGPFGVFAFGLVLGAITNLLDNAFYWLRVRWVTPLVEGEKVRKIYIGVDEDESGNPQIIVADNGPGLDADPEELTRAFVSTRPEGMGLGLYYANMVMELNEGTLSFPDPLDLDLPPEFDGAVIAMTFKRG
ncbi:MULTISPECIES: ATP-binding protein [Hyphobacterium]|uniref:ATP-binding protein n=1 Tax=Hyphobacterium vulgare TaxID=1736751 RepID=A0ABV6ZWJ2_9PROT